MLWDLAAVYVFTWKTTARKTASSASANSFSWSRHPKWSLFHDCPSFDKNASILLSTSALTQKMPHLCLSWSMSYAPTMMLTLTSAVRRSACIMSSTPTIACRACKHSITSSLGRNTHREHIFKIAQKTPQHFEGETTRVSVAITLWTYKIHRTCTHAHTCRTRNSITNISNSGCTGIEHSMTNEKFRRPEAGTISCTDIANPSTGLN